MTPYERHHQTTIWARYATIFLGIWLFSTPLTFSIADTPILWSDLATGFLLTLFGFFSLNKKNTWAVWGVVLLGIWLQIAPLFFWASDPLSYLNDTFTGVLAITFALLIPGTPGESTSTNQPIPLGWSYNPSSWVQRMPIICLCLVCWFTARYMAAYQLGYLNEIWDPVFNNGTLKVITSAISNAFPISDAGLGAAAYTIETLMGCKGGSKRWYTMPWLVIMFGILVIPVGLISVILIMLQPIMIGYWCFWCLLTALCMLIMIALTVDEVMAVLQFLMQTTRDGRPFWKTFWKGGEDIHPDPQQTGHSNPKFSCEHDDVKANAPNPDVCEARKKDITDYVLEREQKLFAHSRLVGWRTAGLIALAVASFFLSIRLAPSIVAASKSMHRAYIICAAGSILAGFVIPNLYRL